MNISGLDGAGHIVEEIEAPNRNMIKGFICLLFLTQIVYILPIIAATSLPLKGETPESWGQGHWVQVGEEAGGHILAVLVMVGGAISCFGFLTALLCTTSRALQGFAIMKVFPEQINAHLSSTHPVYQTPVSAIVFNSFLTFVLSTSFDFTMLVDVGQMMYSLRLLLIFASLLVIRRKHPNLKRPFVIPGGQKGLFLATVPPSVYCLVLLIAGLFVSVETTLVVFAFVVFSVVFSCMSGQCFEMEALEGRIKKTRLGTEIKTPTTPLAEQKAAMVRSASRRGVMAAD